MRRRGRPLIVWQRILGFPPQMWRPLRRLRWRAIVRRVDAAVALTPDLGDELRRLGFDGPIWAIPNFRDPEPFVAVDRERAVARAARGARHRRRRRARRFRRSPDRAEATRPRARRAGRDAPARRAGPPRGRRRRPAAQPLRAATSPNAGSTRTCTCSVTATTSPQILGGDRRVHPHERLRRAPRRADRGADGGLPDRDRARRRRARPRRRRRDRAS